MTTSGETGGDWRGFVVPLPVLRPGLCRSRLLRRLLPGWRGPGRRRRHDSQQLSDQRNAGYGQRQGRPARPWQSSGDAGRPVGERSCPAAGLCRPRPEGLSAHRTSASVRRSATSSWSNDRARCLRDRGQRSRTASSPCLRGRSTDRRSEATCRGHGRTRQWRSRRHEPAQGRQRGDAGYRPQPGRHLGGHGCRFERHPNLEPERLVERPGVQRPAPDPRSATVERVVQHAARVGRTRSAGRGRHRRRDRWRYRERRRTATSRTGAPKVSRARSAPGSRRRRPRLGGAVRAASLRFTQSHPDTSA